VSEWYDEAAQAMQDTLSHLAAEGKLNRQGQKGMLTHATIVFENMAEDGELWWGVIQMPGDHGRDLLIHDRILHEHATGWLQDDGDEDAGSPD